MDVLRAFSLRRTEQTSRADRRQRKNSAGGYTFTLDDPARLRRFLMLDVVGFDAAVPSLITEFARGI